MRRVIEMGTYKYFSLKHSPSNFYPSNFSKSKSKPKTTNSESKIKKFLEDLINKEIDSLQQKYNTNRRLIIQALNIILEKRRWIITLSPEEERQFLSITDRNYNLYKDVATLTKDGDYTSEHYNAKLVCEILRKLGITPPIRVTIRKEGGKLKIKISRRSE